jgi:hypothetical protein
MRRLDIARRPRSANLIWTVIETAKRRFELPATTAVRPLVILPVAEVNLAFTGEPNGGSILRRGFNWLPLAHCLFPFFTPDTRRMAETEGLGSRVAGLRPQSGLINISCWDEGESGRVGHAMPAR